MAFSDQALQDMVDNLSTTKVAMRRDAEGWDNRRTAQHWIDASLALLNHPDYEAAEKTDARRAALPGSISAGNTPMPALTELMTGLVANLQTRLANNPPHLILEGLNEIEKTANRIAREIDDYQKKRDHWFDTDFEKEMAAKGTGKVEDLQPA